jgi:hypothetical protein
LGAGLGFTSGGDPLPFDSEGDPLPFPFEDDPLPFDSEGDPLPFPFEDDPLPFDSEGDPLPLPGVGAGGAYSVSFLSGSCLLRKSSRASVRMGTAQSAIAKRV